MSNHQKSRPVVFLVCTGLGNINRGYESFTRECFDSLKENKEFDLFLLKGAGNSCSNEIGIPNFSRLKKPAKLLAKLFQRPPYNIEQASFCFCLIPLIIRKRPALIYYSDFITGTYLWYLRKYLGFKYRLLFANGAPNGPPYKTEDHVQQLLPVYHSIGVKCDGNKKHTYLPYAFDINIEKRKKHLDQREIIRRRLGFARTQKVILAVGAINMHHKRMHYIINEVATLDASFCLMMIGQYEQETTEVLELANKKLAGRNIIANVPHKEMGDYYVAADFFVLASLQEGFPRVSIEALSYGLPCIVHDYVVGRQILQGNGIYVDMRFDGALSAALKDIKVGTSNKQDAIKAAYDNYSWDVLKAGYSGIIKNQLKAANAN
ncbi:MAG TPA: glycosyltransferase [Parafilimonas sp.]|nr:glycosyltransferase [Parafilimonas sp.]